MKTNYLYIAIVVLVVLVGVFAFGQGSKNQTSQSVTSSQTKLTKLPALHFQDYDDKMVSLAQFAGKPLVVNVWASWCPFCVEELVDFATVEQEFGDQVVIVAVNRAESREAAKQFSDAYQVTGKLTLALDPDDSFYKAVGGFSMPETLFVDRSGNVIEHVRGPMKLDTIREKIRQLIETD